MSLSSSRKGCLPVLSTLLILVIQYAVLIKVTPVSAEDYCVTEQNPPLEITLCTKDKDCLTPDGSNASFVCPVGFQPADANQKNKCRCQGSKGGAKTCQSPRNQSAPVCVSTATGKPNPHHREVKALLERCLKDKTSGTGGAQTEFEQAMRVCEQSNGLPEEVLACKEAAIAKRNEEQKNEMAECLNEYMAPFERKKAPGVCVSDRNTTFVPQSPQVSCKGQGCDLVSIVRALDEGEEGRKEVVAQYAQCLALDEITADTTTTESLKSELFDAQSAE